MDMKSELKKYKVLGPKLHRQLNFIDTLSMSRIYHYLEISCSQGHSGNYSIWFQPNQQSIEIWPIPFKNGDPINNQIETTGKTV